eukprot:12924529-Prorocentrum_lima.AAC.1
MALLQTETTQSTSNLDLRYASWSYVMAYEPLATPLAVIVIVSCGGKLMARWLGVMFLTPSRSGSAS